ncbi:arachidonate 12-lipoxygenase, 12R-type-like [Larimichthys crocea]|uniref:arachidonate 12-lipoxygenase, 12R-type-like n=1 Tax=Larimichthys crocea TaxID=215358 RepID=UPI000F5FD215|nr:arachidonate 12-lipoxygenase, 12R-type-like [Larimichthys crocea]
MVDYKVTVFTGTRVTATTLDRVLIKLVGTDGESDCEKLIKRTTVIGAVSDFTISCPVSIGELLLIEIQKQSFLWITHDDWFPAKVEVQSPEGKTYTFPIYRWITDREVHRFREGKALRVFDETHQLCKLDREQELKNRAKEYCWDEYAEGIPHTIKADNTSSLPPEVRFSFNKKMEFGFNLLTRLAELNLQGYYYKKKNWDDIDDIDHVFWSKRTAISDYVQEHWKEDAFFGYQFLNGVNPMLIRRCTALPGNFPVTDEMVQFSLEDEMKEGNIFLCDYKRLDGVEPNAINNKIQYLMAPLVLLHKIPDNKLMPIAIQLKQTPADDNPIFLPTDECDWLMAKMFVRSADFHEHEYNVHLLRTHLLAEVFAVSLLRNVPMVHPLYKLLKLHTRYTMHINVLARLTLISKEGILPQISACSREGMITILKKSLSTMTYSSLCIRDDITERGVEDVPNFYYKDDGLWLWDIIHRFVHKVLSYYYKNDDEVQRDTELQKWILDIFEHGFLSQAGTGIPEKLSTVDDLVKYVTMVIFTCSAQHAAVNAGQYDYSSWMPNTPTSMQHRPPTTKGTTMVETIPNISTTVKGMATMWLLSQPPSDFVALGDYPEEHFNEEVPCEAIKDFRHELKVLSARIRVRNTSLEIPYTYMDPTEIENSVSI